MNFPTISIHHQKGQHAKETSLSLMIFIVLLPFFEIYKKIRRVNFPQKTIFALLLAAGY
jgi:hypothetical protein